MDGALGLVESEVGERGEAPVLNGKVPADSKEARESAGTLS
jgi:hypothetical protein